MKIYFKDRNKNERYLATVEDVKRAHEVIRDFCSARHFEVLYIRSRRTKENQLIIDVGSHYEFFIIQFEVGES